jgi:hypothetical protein
VRCGEAEAGVHFIGPGSRWGGGEVASGGGVLLLVSFEGVKGEEETWWHHLDGEMKVGHRFGSATRTWRRAADGGARRGGVAGGAAVPMEAGGGRRRPGGPYRAKRPSGAGRFRWE